MKLPKINVNLEDFDYLDDYGERLQALVLHTFAWFGIFAVSFVAINLIVFPFAGWLLMTILFVWVSSFTTLRLIKLKKIYVAKWFFSCAVGGLLITLSLVFPGLYSLVFIASLIISPLLFGLLISSRMSLLVMLLNFFVGFYMVWLEQQPNFTPLDYIPIGQMIGYIAIFSSLPTLVYLGRTLFLRMIETAKAEEAAYVVKEALESQNILLEAAIFERTVYLEETLEKQQQMASKLEIALLESNEMSHLQSRMISKISHEFRTPLTVINTSFDMLEKYGDRLSDEKREKHKQRVKNGVFRLAKLLENVSDANNLMRSGIIPKPTEFEAAHLFRLLEAGIKERAKENGRLSFAYNSDDTYLVWADQHLLIDLLHIFATNALKFSNEMHKVYLTFLHKDNRLIFTVKDNGIGVPIAETSEIFRLLYRAENADAYAGLGLGLHLAQRIVDALSGQIDCQSEGEGCGALFTAVVPTTLLEKPEEIIAK